MTARDLQYCRPIAKIMLMLRCLQLPQVVSLVICLLALSFSALAQGSGASVLKLGNRTVRVPSPSGLVEGSARFSHLKSRFVVTESPGNDMLAVFVPESILPILEKGNIPPYDQWAKISILKKFNATDVDAATFKLFADKFEKTLPQLIDEQSPAFKNAVSNMRKGLSGLLGQKVEADLTQPKSLGIFDRQQNIHSTLIVSTLSDARGSRLILGTLSLLRVNQRLLFVYTYQTLTDENDADRIRKFTKKWTADILAANK